MITKEQLESIKECLVDASAFLNNDLDSVCDDDYADEIKSVIDNIERSVEIINDGLQ